MSHPKITEREFVTARDDLRTDLEITGRPKSIERLDVLLMRVRDLEDEAEAAAGFAKTYREAHADEVKRTDAFVREVSEILGPMMAFNIDGTLSRMLALEAIRDEVKDLVAKVILCGREMERIIADSKTEIDETKSVVGRMTSLIVRQAEIICSVIATDGTPNPLPEPDPEQ